MTTLVRTADPNKLIHGQVVQQGPTTEHVWVQVALLCVSSGALHFHVFYVKNSRCPISRQALARKGPSIEGCRRCWTLAPVLAEAHSSRSSTINRVNSRYASSEALPQSCIQFGDETPHPFSCLEILPRRAGRSS